MLDSLEDDLSAVVGFEREHGDRRVAIGGREGEAVAHEDDGEDDFGFHEGEALANTVARAEGERQEGKRMPTSVGDALFETLWLEFVSVVSPELRIQVYRQHRNPHRRIFRNE